MVEEMACILNDGRSELSFMDSSTKVEYFFCLGTLASSDVAHQVYGLAESECSLFGSSSSSKTDMTLKLNINASEIFNRNFTDFS